MCRVIFCKVLQNAKNNNGMQYENTLLETSKSCCVEKISTAVAEAALHWDWREYVYAAPPPPPSISGSLKEFLEGTTKSIIYNWPSG